MLLPAAAIRTSRYGSFQQLGVPYLGVLVRRILLFRVRNFGSLLSETPVYTLAHDLLVKVTRVVWISMSSASTTSGQPNLGCFLTKNATREGLGLSLGLRVYAYYKTVACIDTLHAERPSRSDVPS